YDDNSSLSRAFHSSDLGASWTEITPIGRSRSIRARSGMSLLVAGKTIFAETTTRFRSRDGGQTWVDLGFDRDSFVLSGLAAVAGNENTFYKAGRSGVYRTTDGGESWHLFMDGMIGTGILDLVTLNNKLYAHTGDALVQSVDRGESWKTVRIGVSNGRHSAIEARQSYISISSDSWLTVANNRLYVFLPEKGNLGIFRLSADGNSLVRFQGIPTFEVDAPSIKVSTHSSGTGQAHSAHGHGDDNSVKTLRRKEHEAIGAFRFTDFTEILFAGSTVYVATDGGILASQTGMHWRVITDEGVIERLAVDGPTIYGAGDNGVYRLEAHDEWNQISPNVPGKVLALVVDRDRLYVATERRGMFHISLKGENYALSHKYLKD
ncbi:MAG: hypothetical protein OXU23_17590, partial [Candidatus Poribacteria bacterium]|nr:hypothetical protein [Candidatus Poribacteria bacterium]